jgi:hypothetical protein
MLTKKTMALAMALTLGLATAAIAKTSGGHPTKSGEGVNPADHRSLGGGEKEPISYNGKCWDVDPSKIGGWSTCPKKKHHKG